MDQYLHKVAINVGQYKKVPTVNITVGKNAYIEFY